MHTLLVLIFEKEMGAQEMIRHVQSLQRQQLITISDAAFVIRKKDGRTKVKQANSLVGSGALGGAFWGLLIGRHFWLPLNTETIAHDVDASIADGELDCGIDDVFLRQVGNSIQPGCSALFMIVAYITEENLIALDNADNTLLYTYLSAERDTQFRKAFGIMEEI